MNWMNARRILVLMLGLCLAASSAYACGIGKGKLGKFGKKSAGKISAGALSNTGAGVSTVPGA